MSRNYYWQEVYLGSLAAFRTLVPEPSHRIPITWRTFPNTIAHLIPLVFMAYLVRRPNTYIVRLLLLPTVIVMTMRACFGYMWMDAQLNVFNWGEGLFALTCIGKALDFAFAKNGRHKVGEATPGEVKTPAISRKDRSNGWPAEVPSANRPLGSILPVWFEDAMEILHSMRGIGWDFGKGVYVPPETRPLDRGPYLLATMVSFQVNFFLLDFLESCLKLVPGVGSPMGGTIFPPNVPPFYRYTISTTIHLMTGTAFIAGFRMIYDITTLISVGILRHVPSSWPPVIDNPWISNSLHEFWAKRWHQLLRQTFLTFGGYPGQFVAGKLGLVMGTFIASGLFHECAMYCMGRGWDWRVMIFFVSQGFALILERFWRVVTGRRVGGWSGRMWVYFCIFILGQPCVDAWHQRGLAGGMVIPPVISPTRRILFPLILRLTGR